LTQCRHQGSFAEIVPSERLEERYPKDAPG
jgi:hypothetical protein